MSIKTYNWVPFFSHTGSEICDLIDDLKHEPVAIITNNNKVEKLDLRLLKYNIYFLPTRPTAKDYLDMLEFLNDIHGDELKITLHGFMRIIPDEVLEIYKMVNLHPGLITKYPQLKGKDPQKKAFDLKLESSGAVIHEVTNDLDGGEILIVSDEINIKNLELDVVYNKIKEQSLVIWKQHFEEIG